VREFPTNPALEAAIIAHTDEDTPRLVYADWLDENGDPDRAAFIRVQCRLADLTPGDPDWFELTQNEAELTTRLQTRFAGMRRRSAGDWGTHHRGFPFSINCNPRSGEWTDDETTRIAEELTRIVTTTTIRGISLHGAPPDQFAKLVTRPVFSAIHRLTFDFAQIWEQERAAIAIQRLARPESSRNLRQLSVQTTIWPQMIDGLVAPDVFPNLRQLWLPYLRCPAHDVRRLMTGNWVHKLKELNLSLWNTALAEPLLTSAGDLQELHTLAMVHAPPSIAEHLAPGPFPQLVSLACPDARIRLQGLQKMLGAAWFARLRVLDLTSNELGDRALVALASHPVARSLRVLRLGNNPFGRTGLTALTQPETFPELTWLDLSLTNTKKRKVTEADLTRFLAHLALPRLRRLDLSRLPTGDGGAQAIAANPALGELRELQLGDGVKDHGMNALRTAGHLQKTKLVCPTTT
jgi:uncharacterized protein (TIGR02996 family)